MYVLQRGARVANGAEGSVRTEGWSPGAGLGRGGPSHQPGVFHFHPPSSLSSSILNSFSFSAFHTSTQPVLRMPATLSSLPPEVVLKILRHLPGPCFGGPRPLEAPSALLATALVSKDFAVLSQEVLFEDVYLCGKQDVLRWAATEARRATRKLRVVLGRSDFHKKRDWLAELMMDVFGKVKEGEEAGLRTLEMAGVPDSRMGEGRTGLAGLQGEHDASEGSRPSRLLTR